MRLEDIIEDTLTYQYRDKYTNRVYTQKPEYRLEDNVLHILTPIKPYKLVVLRRLLNIRKINIENIIIGYPDV